MASSLYSMASFPMKVCASNSHSSFCLPNFLLILQLPVQISSPPESLPQTFPSLLSSVFPKSLKLIPYFFIFHLNYTSHYRKYAKAQCFPQVPCKQHWGQETKHHQILRSSTLPFLQQFWKTGWGQTTFPQWLHIQTFSSHPDNGACIECLAL